MRTAILAVLLAACAPASPPADGPAVGWLDVDDGRGPQPLTTCTWDVAWSPDGDVLRLYARAEPYRMDAIWNPGSTSTRAAQYDDCPVVDGVSECMSGQQHRCDGVVEESSPGTWSVDVTCEDGAHVTGEVTSCERM